VVASMGGLRRWERPLHAAFRRPSIQPKRPDKMMAGAAGPSAVPSWARSAYLPPSQLGASASTSVASARSTVTTRRSPALGDACGRQGGAKTWRAAKCGALCRTNFEF
jgi:hypothetical protein